MMMAQQVVLAPVVGPSAWQVLATLGALVGVFSLIFALGYNWRRVTVLEESFANLAVMLDRSYARKDLIELELRSMRERLDLISRQLTQLLKAAADDDP